MSLYKFLAFFIVFEWVRILESVMDKLEVKCQAKLHSNYFSVNFSIPDVVFHQKISKTTISGKIVELLKFGGEIQELVRKRSQRNNKDVISHYISHPLYPLHLPKFCPIQKQ